MSTPPASIGPYRILGPLGRGGMGNVFLADRPGAPERVALKTVAAPTAGMVASIRREIGTLRRLPHPGIVRILDDGVDGGLPWYAMELCEGATLRRWAAGLRPASPDALTVTGAPQDSELLPTEPIATVPMTQASLGPRPPARAAPLHPDALARILTLAYRLCAPLSFLHGEGIVHRDLKPDNVLVRPDGAPVIVDFGLTGHFAGIVSRDALQDVGQACGTVWYMAPEQARGDVVDARADLYSLGCILFELLTGRLPFPGNRPALVLRRHLQSPPPPASELRDGVPPELDALLTRLLRKEPPERLGHADDVAAALLALGAEPEGHEDAARPARAYLYRPRLVGRDGALSELERALGSDAGAGRMVFVSGESGSGKTRLVLELALRATERGMCVLAGGGPPGDGAGVRSLGALHGPLQAIADRCRELGSPEIRDLLGPRMKVLSPHHPAFASLPDHDRFPDPPELPPEAERLRLFGSLAEILAVLGRRDRLLLILDDLQWADELTLSFLDYLRRSRLAELPLAVVATYRADEVGPGLARLLGHPATETLPLPRLAEDAVSALVSDMLAVSPPPPALVGQVASLSEGNPFFVAEYLRAAVAEGVLFRDAAGRWRTTFGAALTSGGPPAASLPLPGSLRDLLVRRLDALPRTARRVAETLAVFGRETDGAMLLAASDLGDADVVEAIGVLLSRDVLAEPRPGGYTFTHDRLREVVHGSLDASARKHLHHAAAQAMERTASEVRPHDLALLAHHWHEAGDTGRARVLYLEAAREASDRYDHAEAERLSAAGILLTEGKERARALLSLARTQGLRGRREEARASIEEALEIARGVGDRASEADALTALGTIHRMIGSLRDAEPLLEEALQRHRELHDRKAEGQASHELAIVARALGEPARARRLHEAALAIHREVGNTLGVGTALMNLAGLLQEAGQLAGARPACEEALAIHRRGGHRYAEAVALGNLAVLCSDPAEAIPHVQEALRIHQELGDRPSEATCTGNFAMIRYEQGRIDEAAALCERAIDLQREVGNRDGEGVLLGNLAAIRQEQGRLPEAHALTLRALDLHRATGSRRYLGIALSRLAAVACAGGSLDEAERCCDEALGILRDVGDPGHEALTLRVLADVRAAQGRPAEAGRLYEDALAIQHRIGDGAEAAKTAAAMAWTGTVAARPLTPRVDRTPEAPSERLSSPRRRRPR